VEAENAARDAHNREIWVKTLRDTEEYFRNYFTANTPVELVYENKIEEIKDSQDFVKKTISVQFNAALVPVESGWSRAVENTVSDLRKQLLATGRAEAWGLAKWPETALTSPSPFRSRTGSVNADAELLNENGRVMGRQSFSLTWNLTTSFSGKGISLGIDLDSLRPSTVVFQNILIDDITDTLQIRIAKINGENAETAAAQGRIQYSTDWQRWLAVARGQQFRKSARAAGEASVATGKFLMNYILPIPHYLGVGTTIGMGTIFFDTPVLFLSAYNKIFFDIFYIDYGCDFGFIHGLVADIKDVGYYSFYPNAHIGLGVRENADFGVIVGLGGGYMLSTYTFPHDTVHTAAPSFDFNMGVRFVDIIEFTYSLRVASFTLPLINHKLQLGFRVIPKF
jgi:hypothetical protein